MNLNAFINIIIPMIVWTAIGYLGKQPDEAFDKGKIFFTFVAAFIVAILGVGWNIPEELGIQFYEYLLYRSGFVGIVYKILRAAYIKSGLKDWWNNLPSD